ncbi:hypothetical protein F5B21DRAFT_520020 [Xylaria acuta]|nr:hypothetical protein F5B21DRAFT_520020 [Xylaria acuta]
MADRRSEGKSTKQLEGGESASQLQKRAKYSHPTVPMVEDFGEAAQSGNAEVGIKDLVQFFRKTPPPPTNFMSIPDNFSGSSGEDKWDKFKTKVFRRPSKKIRKRRPPLIILPDSAVAARTTDGHRYIAISIPTEQSPLEPRPTSQYPVYGSVEAAFQQDVNSKFGMWKISPANRLVTVLNPVPEDLRESTSSGSPLSTAFEQPDPETALSAPSARKRAHTVSLSPRQEQRYTPRKAKDPARNRSISDPHTASPTIPQGNEGKRGSTSQTAETSEPEPSRQNVPSATASKDIGAAEPSTSRLPENPAITLTLPSRKSSRRGIQLEPAPPDTAEKATSPCQGSPPSTSGTNGNGNGNSDGGGNQRASFAASIETTSSSPQLLKATTAIVGQSIPIVVRPASSDVDSPLDLDFPEPPPGKRKTGREFRTSAVGLPPTKLAVLERSQSRKERACERKQREAEKQGVRTESKGKGKEPAPPHHRAREEDDSSTSPSLSSSPTESSVSAHDDRGGAAADRVPSPTSQKKEQREEREARYMAKALAAERETLERLPREELVRRYEALREQRIYERERRLRRLERGRDTWTRAVPMLLQDLNGLLRQQHRILEGYGLTAHGLPTTTTTTTTTPAGSSQYHHHHHGHHGHHHPHLRHTQTRRRSRSVDVSSSGSPAI